jgi:cytochrome c oxidase assembly factor CtaG
MTAARMLTSTWSWYPSVLIGCLALLIAYALAVFSTLRYEGPGTQRAAPAASDRPAIAGRSALFAGGVAVLCFSLVSPLDALGDDYLFSAHMLQHMLLLQVVPLLLLAGISPAMAARGLSWTPARRAERALRSLPLAWSLAALTLFAWHVPFLYNAALANDSIHTLEHLCFLVTAVIFWWPIVAPLPESRAGTLGGVFYLFTAMAATAALGIFFTFTPPGLYPAYLNRPADGITAFLQQGWGLTPRVDQQIGGLLMWVGGGVVYLLGLGILLARWYGAPEAEDEFADQAPAGSVQAGPVQADLVQADLVPADLVSADWPKGRSASNARS